MVYVSQINIFLVHLILCVCVSHYAYFCVKHGKHINLPRSLVVHILHSIITYWQVVYACYSWWQWQFYCTRRLRPSTTPSTRFWKKWRTRTWTTSWFGRRAVWTVYIRPPSSEYWTQYTAVNTVSQRLHTSIASISSLQYHFV